MELIDHQHTAIETCPCCNSKNITTAHEKRNYIVGCFKTLVAYNYKVCNTCNHYYVQNPLNKSSLEYYYKNSTQLRRSDISKIEDTVFIKQIEFISKKFNIKNSRILEIGCDTGQFLNKIRSYGGITFHSELSSRAKDFLNKSSHKEFKESDEPLDLVIARHVLEHTENPSEFLNNISHIISENGMIFIEVPDFTDPDKQTDNVIFEHTHNFSTISLLKLLDLSGLKPINIDYDQTDGYGTTPNKVIRVLCNKKLYGFKSHSECISKHYENTLKILYKNIETLSYEHRISFYAASWITQDILLNTNIRDKVIGIYDGDPNKQGSDFMGFTVSTPEESLIVQQDLIIVTSSYYEEIKTDLINLGYSGRVITHTDLMS